jgi:hypothetical protein
MAKDMTGQNNDGAATKKDLSLAKSEMKGNLLSVRNELLSSQSNLSEMVGDVKEGNRRIMVALAQVVGTLTEMKENYATKAEVRELRSEVLNRMDGFAGSLEDFKRQWAFQSDGLMLHEARLDDHERRLGKIESRPQ